MEIGETIAGRYTIEGVLGSGGMSRVYRAHDNVLERDVALKVLHDRLSDDPQYVERFRREARAIARLSHPNIVTVIDRGQVEGCEFIVFELVRGANLKELVGSRSVLPVAEALALVHQAARGLAFAHAHGIVHRDVKPQNVLVDGDGIAKVTDFGIARSLHGEQGLTESGAIIGTGHYLSPEQATGRTVGEAADQYSLGALLYELLAGEPPYAGESVVAIAARHVRDPVPSVRDARPDVPPRVDALVRRAMAKQPEDRFPSMDAFAAGVEACMAALAEAPGPAGNGATEVIAPVAAPPGRPRPERHEGRPERREPKRRRVPAALLAMVVVLGLGAGAVWTLATGRLDPTGGGGEAAPVETIELQAVRDWDPEGDGVEHTARVPNATDGDPETFWTTETYQDFSALKSGVGIVLDAGRPVELGGLVVESGEPGFTARVRAGPGEEGPFEDVSEEATIEARTRLEVDTGGEAYRYYLFWITSLEGRAIVNEIRAGD